MKGINDAVQLAHEHHAGLWRGDHEKICDLRDGLLALHSARFLVECERDLLAHALRNVLAACERTGIADSDPDWYVTAKQALKMPTLKQKGGADHE